MVMKLKRTVDKKGVIRYYNPDIDTLHEALVLRISSNGSITHWKNGSEHREDGPAVEYTNGGKEWFINGVQYTEEEFNRWLEKYQLNKKLQHTLEVKPLGNKLKI